MKLEAYDGKDGIRYYDKGGMPYPSVTSILDGIAEPWIHKWRREEAMRVLLDEMTPADLKTKGGKQKIVKDSSQHAGENARTLGTWMHALAESRFKNWPQPGPLDQFPRECATLVMNFNEWVEMMIPYEVVASEETVFGSIENTKMGEPMPYAGTVDLILDAHSHRYLIDIKTSRQLSGDYGAQVCGYAWAWNQSHPKEERITRLMIARLSKTALGEIEPEILGRQAAGLGMELFYNALSAHYVRSGHWGMIIGN